MELEHKDITEQIIGASFEVFRELGYGFLERVYQRAMKVELQLRGLSREIETITLDLDDGVKVNYAKFGDLLAETKAICGTKDED